MRQMRYGVDINNIIRICIMRLLVVVRSGVPLIHAPASLPFVPV